MKSRVTRSSEKLKLNRCSVRLARIDGLIAKHKKMPVKKPSTITTRTIDASPKEVIKSRVGRKRKNKAITEQPVETVRGKRVPKPNRKYINDSISLSHKLSELDSESEGVTEFSGLDEDDMEYEKPPTPEPKPKRLAALLKKTPTAASPRAVKQTSSESKAFSKAGPASVKRRKEEKKSLKKLRRFSETSSSSDDFGDTGFDTDFDMPLVKAKSDIKMPLAISRPTLRASTQAASQAKTEPTKIEDKSSEKPPDLIDLEDFEQMPTFTIVNINDIINQKEEIVVIEKDKLKTKEAKIVQDSEDDLEVKLEKLHSSTSRRKTQHTVRMDKINRKVKPTTPNVLQANKPLVKQEPNKPYRNIIGNKNGKFNEPEKQEKLPPRILNSALCKNVGNDLITPVVKTQKSLEPKRFYNKTMPNQDGSRSKENLKTTTSQQMLSKMKPKTLVETYMGNRRVRKITCFETWFVIKFAPIDQPSTPKCWIQFPLMKLGNDIKKINLPSDRWSYKISLQRIMKDTEEDADLYTGEVHDPLINPNDRHLYQPVNIMFRRACNDTNLNMQFDRVVIFKNQLCFVHIDGRNVKLLGAPTYLQDFEEIDVLLQIVDDLSLVNPCVEQSAFIV